MTATEGTVRTAHADLHYLRRPVESAPTLLLLHGITDGGAVWGRVADALGDRFDIVMPDARGHGLSSRIAGGITVPELADDTAALIEDLEIGAPLIWGHSLGAATAAVLAASRPDLVAGAVLEDPPLRDEPLAAPESTDAAPRAADFPTLLSSMAAMSADERVATARQANPSWHDAELAPWADTKAQFDPTALSMMTDGLGFDWRATAALVRCPALLVTGDAEQGALVSPEVAAEAVGLMPAGQVAHIAGAGHNIHRDRFEQTLAAVLGFLDAAAPAV